MEYEKAGAARVAGWAEDAKTGSRVFYQSGESIPAGSAVPPLIVQLTGIELPELQSVQQRYQLNRIAAGNYQTPGID